MPLRSRMRINGITTETERDKANFFLQMWVAISVILINGSLLIIVSFIEIPGKNDAAFNILLGNAMGWFSALIAFSFPNSIGTAKKDDTISKLADKAQGLNIPKEGLDVTTTIEPGAGSDAGDKGKAGHAGSSTGEGGEGGAGGSGGAGGPGGSSGAATSSVGEKSQQGVQAKDTVDPGYPWGKS